MNELLPYVHIESLPRLFAEFILSGAKILRLRLRMTAAKGSE